MSYPLTIRFKILAIARQISVEDATGQLLLYVKQKAFKLKEAVTVFADREQTRPLYEINADRVIDFNAAYRITDMQGAELGSIRQQGMRSIWRARFDIVRNDQVLFQISEENPWTKMADSFLGEIPVIGLLSGYLLHPRYLITAAGGNPVIQIEKQPAFLEGVFRFERLGTPLSPDDERLVLLSSLMMVLLERRRG
ncbi:MAG: hypothetical protein WEE89_18030 [Gemmatimonadota bacterium]